jgi:hypothetical protein
MLAAALAISGCTAGLEERRGCGCGPASRPTAAAGIVYRLPDARKKDVVAQDLAGKPLLAARHKLKPVGLALWDAGGALRLDGGSFVDQRIGPVMSREITAAGTFHISVGLVPAAAESPPGDVLCIPGAVVLSQRGRALVLSCAPAPDEIVLTEHVSARPLHLAISIGGGAVEWRIDGKPAGGRELRCSPAPSDAPLTIGASPLGQRPWKGLLDGLTICTGGIDAAAEAQAFASRAARRSARQVRVEAVLAETSSLEGEWPHNGTYDRAWQLNAFDVRRVLEGRMETGRIHVAQWVWAGRIYTHVRDQRPGEVYVLTLEDADVHDELEAEMTYDDFAETALRRYVDVGALAPSATPQGAAD